MKKYTLITAIAAIIMTLATSCFAFKNNTSKFGEVQLGMTRETIVNQYGQPFMENLAERNGQKYNVMCYKEQIYNNGAWHEITTNLYLIDGKLSDKEQFSGRLPNNDNNNDTHKH